MGGTIRLFKFSGITVYLHFSWFLIAAYEFTRRMGVYSSPVYDATAPVVWQNASWVADMPAGTNVLVEVRTGTTPTPDATNWTAFQATTSGGAMTGTSQYAQYRLTLSTTVPNAAPAVKEVVVNFVR